MYYGSSQLLWNVCKAASAWFKFRISPPEPRHRTPLSLTWSVTAFAHLSHPDHLTHLTQLAQLAYLSLLTYLAHLTHLSHFAHFIHLAHLAHAPPRSQGLSYKKSTTFNEGFSPWLSWLKTMKKLDKILQYPQLFRPAVRTHLLLMRPKAKP